MRLPALAAILIVTGGLLTACGVNTSGVRNLSLDTFTISVDDLKDTTAKGTALGLAESFCQKRQQEVLVTQLLKRHQQLRYYYDVTFQCLEPGDPRLKNPEYETIYKSD